jgi:protein O-GlcNAc transferase
LITGSLDEYILKAVRLAGEPENLDRIREKIARHRTTQPLFKTTQWVRQLEQAFRRMWQTFRSGAPVHQINIASDS